jgi:hypothetical protein
MTRLTDLYHAQYRLFLNMYALSCPACMMEVVYHDDVSLKFDPLCPKQEHLTNHQLLKIKMTESRKIFFDSLNGNFT